MIIDPTKLENHLAYSGELVTQYDGRAWTLTERPSVTRLPVSMLFDLNGDLPPTRPLLVPGGRYRLVMLFKGRQVQFDVDGMSDDVTLNMVDRGRGWFQAVITGYAGWIDPVISWPADAVECFGPRMVERLDTPYIPTRSPA